MQTKVRVALCIGERVYFVSPNDAPERHATLPYVELIDYAVKDGRVEWEMRTNQGHVLMGRVKDEQRLPLFKDSWVTLAVPVTLHTRTKGLGPDFIFNLPSHLNAEKAPFARAS